MKSASVFFEKETVGKSREEWYNRHALQKEKQQTERGYSMAFEFESRVRYSETGPDQKLTLVSLVDYFQDSSTFQSEDWDELSVRA